MLTLNAAASLFGKVDQLPDDQLPALDKSLRNISQRVYLPPAERQGRADLYGLPAICALRILQVAMGFGIDRVKLESLARFLQVGAGNGRKVAVEGGFRALSPIEEAIDRVRAKEAFDFKCAFYKGGRIHWSADWPHDDPEAERFTDRFFKDVGSEAPVAIFAVHGSLLIQELLAALDQAKG